MFTRRAVVTGAGSLLFASTVFNVRRAYAAADDLSFGDLLYLVQSQDEPPIGAGAGREIKDLIAADEYFLKGAATSSSPKSSTTVSQDAIDLIVAFEVSSKNAYNKKYTRPIWPQGNSGVTIGIGYDIGYVTKKKLHEDWKGYVPESDIVYLEAACGVRGPAAKNLTPKLQNFAVNFDVAYKEFMEQVLPSYIWDTENALDNTKELRSISPSCLGALVSLTYNRGPSYGQDGKDRYREMCAIRDHMVAKEFGKIPAEIRSMKRIWQGDPSMRGLLIRREAEAKLFEQGLAGA
jgi:GH24 family phage-related lysozyme (muramidase)